LCGKIGLVFLLKEDVMRPLQTDLSVWKKLKLDKPPVGVKFLFEKPGGIEPLDKKLGLCEMLPEAHQSKTPFYFTKEQESCFGKAPLGMMGEEAVVAAASGLLGYKLELFQEPRANTRLYRQNPSLVKGSVNYVVFAPLNAITFEPDLLVLMTTPSQAELILRATTYSTGDLYESRTSIALSCAWLYVYPYISGKINYFITGLGFGAIGRKVFQPGWVLISIPYDKIPMMTQNLKEMKWVIPAHSFDNKEGFLKYEDKIKEELKKELQKP
jgi:uncharacterized protein (DUF169 family)